MAAHGGGGAVRIAGGNGIHHGRMLGDHPRHAARLGKGEHAEAVHLRLDLLHHPPDAGKIGRLGDGVVERLVGVVEARHVFRRRHSPPALQDGAEAGNLAPRGFQRSGAGGDFLQRGAGDDGLRQGLDRDSRDIGAGLGAMSTSLRRRGAAGPRAPGAAYAMGGGNILLGDHFPRRAPQGDDLVPQVLVDDVGRGHSASRFAQPHGGKAGGRPASHGTFPVWAIRSAGKSGRRPLSALLVY